MIRSLKGCPDTMMDALQKPLTAPGQSVWFFRMDPRALKWRWTCLQEGTGAVLARSPASFATLKDCTEDAKRHGYGD